MITNDTETRMNDRIVLINRWVEIFKI
jgi:hypothetical protein